MLVNRVAEVEFPTRFGLFQLHLYESKVDDHHHLALVKGDTTAGDPVLVRVHSQCLTGDLFHSMRCDCGDQLEAALSMTSNIQYVSARVWPKVTSGQL